LSLVAIRQTPLRSLPAPQLAKLVRVKCRRFLICGILCYPQRGLC
jgi:hypothetical protein